MTKFSTKKALIASVLLLALCFSALVGSTFAWFTDSATSTGNVIKTGKLDIAFEKWNGTAWVDASDAPIFNNEKWEPGYTEIVNLRVRNIGTLALKWQAVASLYGNSISKLADVIDVYVRSDDQNDTVKDYIATVVDRNDFDTKAAEGQFKKFTLRDFLNNLTTMTQGTMVEGQESYLGIVLKMRETAGNEYQNLDLGGKFDLTILATQFTSEFDSINNQYDAGAFFTGYAVEEIPAGASAIELIAKNEAGQAIAVSTITSDSISDGAETLRLLVTKSAYEPNFTIDNGRESITLDITVNNLDPDNTDPIKTKLFIGQNYDPATVSLYHYDTQILSQYNPNTGWISFETTSYSPFTIVYDAESEYVPAAGRPDGAPVAVVTERPDYVGVSLPWGSYGQWSPNADVDADPKLEAAYTFTCPVMSDEDYEKYKYYECDFYVMLDEDLGENEIFLGGNYGTFGWVGFHNGDVTLEANTEIGLLESVTSNPWTYEDVATFVETFTCGVGDVNNALSGATFTVMLRLTNPETRESINVNTVTYTFQ